MYNMVKVFSVTLARDREMLGEKVTEFVSNFRGEIVDKVIVQSSDKAFHCLTIILFCRLEAKRRRMVTPCSL